MAAKKGLTSLPVPPYTWIPEGVKSNVKVFTVAGSFVVHRMSPEGNIRIGPKTMKKNSVQDSFAAPKRMGFVTCPSCQTRHGSLTRWCTECGESLVYYPQVTDKNRKKFIIDGYADTAKTKAKQTAKVRVGEAPEHRKKLEAVRSSLSHLLFTTFEFPTAAALIQKEIQIRATLSIGKPGERLVQSRVQKAVRRASINDSIRLAKLPDYKLKLKQGVEMSDEAVWLTLLLAIAGDAGLTQTAAELVHMKQRLPPSDQHALLDMKYQKDAFINSTYAAQAVARNTGRTYDATSA